MSETAIDGGALVGKPVIGINTGRVIEPAATQFAQNLSLEPQIGRRTSASRDFPCLEL
jgi:hypothetical protein